MKNDPRREEISRSFFSDDLSVYDERLKSHVADTLLRLLQNDLDKLLYGKVIRIIQPVTNTVIELNDLNLSLRDESGSITLVAFESGLCDRPRHEITYFIAHEFAHVFLGHATNRAGSGERDEVEADKKVIEWGFEKELKSSSFNYIYGRRGRKG